MVWDIGTYEITEGNYFKGYIRIFLDGKKLKGEWSLSRSHEGRDQRRQWYLEKQAPDMRALSANQEDQSALTGRTMEQIAKAADRQWQSNRSLNANTDSKTTEENESSSTGAFDLNSLPPAKLAFVPPMLAKPVAALPDGKIWQYEIKLDGYRALIVKDSKEARVFSRRGNRLDHRYPSIAKSFSQLAAGTILDGEIVALDEYGKPVFSALQNAKTCPLYFYVFDILAYRAKDTTKLPLARRRDVLQEALRSLPDPVRESPVIDSSANEIAAAAREQGLEGIVAKRKDSLYESGQRSEAWVKYRTAPGQELVIGGYIPGGEIFEALLAGYYEGRRLLFVGKVKNGLTPFIKRELAKRFKRLHSGRFPFSNLPEPRSARRGKALTREIMGECRWLKPELVAQVNFLEWTEDNHLRHSTFVGIRDDKDAREVRKET
jgi:bifunctional non-homologous end joining protein LigD